MARGAVLLLLALIPTVAFGGTRFHFIVKSTGDPLNPQRSGTVWVDGPSYRVDYDEGAFDASALFSVDGGKSETAINKANRTYFHPRLRLEDALDSRLFAMPAIVASRPQRVTVKDVRLREEPGSHVTEGRNARKYVVTCVYEVEAVTGDERIRGAFNSTAELWTTNDISVAIVPFDPRRMKTGYDSVDAALRQVLSRVQGFPLERRLSVTRRIANGVALTDIVTTTFEQFESVAVPPALLEVPQGYVHQDPILGVANGGNR